jgi:hypothetical protein
MHATKTFRTLALTLAFPLLLAGCAGANGSESPDTEDSPLVSENGNDKIAFEFFVGKGLSKVQAAGIVGNLDQESGMSPTISEIGGGPGRGIAQWSAGGRWDSSFHDNVVWYASAHGESKYALGTQLAFIWYELTTFGYGFSHLKAATTVSAATYAFMDYYEICGKCDASNRIAHANAALADFGGPLPDACNAAPGFCTPTLQCYQGHWIIRQDDPNACNGYTNVEEPCHEDNGYCTPTLQCENGHWVPRASDPAACTHGYGY